MTCSILPAVLPAMKGQQAVGNTTWLYVVNNSSKYEVIPDQTIVACKAPILKSANLVPTLRQVNIEQKIFRCMKEGRTLPPSPQMGRGTRPSLAT